MPQIPRSNNPVSALGLAFDGYNFISERNRRYQSDIFQTQLLFQKIICLRGEEAAKLFYDNNKFKRQGAAPKRLQKTLFGQGGVQGLDDEAHRHRKQAFMSLMSPEGIQQLADITTRQWHIYLKKWENMDEVVLFHEVSELLCRAVCSWTGVPLEESEVKRRTRDFEAMIDGSGGAGPRHWKGRLARKRANAWIKNIIERVRVGSLQVPEGSALHAFSWLRNLDGEFLDAKVAAVDLINVLRPTVAVSRFITFAALTLHEHPECVEKLKTEKDDYPALFVQEVRRYYPFFPFAAARVRHDFEWKGYHFPKGRRVMLDLYGTNHDARLWEKPDEFRPERFRQWNESAFNMIPQGGGDHHQNHRCAGEWITIELMKVALNFLTNSMKYNVPEQDLRISLRRIPAIPKSRFVISNVRSV